MDERELRHAFRSAFDRTRPTAGAADRAFAAVAIGSGAYGPGRRLAGAAAVALALLVVATLLIARGALAPLHSTVPAARPAPTPAASALPTPNAAPRGLANQPPPALVAAESDRIVLAGWSDGGRLALTTDGGATWTALHAPAGQVLDLQFVDADTALVSTDAGLFRYERSAAVWTRLSPRSDLARLDFTGRSSGYAVTSAGDVVETQDGGRTLIAVDVGLHPVTWLQWVSATHAWAAGPQGVAATADGGATWVRQLSFPASTDGPGTGPVVRVQVGFRDEANGFAIAMFDGGAGAAYVLYHTADGGATWTVESCTCHASPPDWLAGSGLGALPYASSALVVTGGSTAMLVGSESEPRPLSVCSTADAGRDWSCGPLPGVGDAAAALGARGQSRWLAVSGTSGQLLATSSDGGATWTVRRP